MEDAGRRTILVADDHPELRRIFSTYLGFVGYNVESAADGEGAYEVERCIGSASGAPPRATARALPAVDEAWCSRRESRRS